MRSFFITLAVCLALVCIVPLMVLGGTGSWRHALNALKQYAKVLAFLTAAGVFMAIITAV